MDTDATHRLIEMRVVDIWRLPDDEDQPCRRFVMLAEAEGTRRFPLWIGQAEAQALALYLEQAELPWPMAYTLMANLILAAGALVRGVQITRLVDTTFYAEIVVEGTEGVRRVDARPSDALNLALLTNVPIRVEPAVLEATAVSDAVASQHDPQRGRNEGAAAIVKEITASWYGPGKPLNQPRPTVDPA